VPGNILVAIFLKNIHHKEDKEYEKEWMKMLFGRFYIKNYHASKRFTKELSRRKYFE